MLHSNIIGDNKKNLIIIHGYFGSGDNWKSLGKKFSENFKVHLVDQRNHGRSPHYDEFNYPIMRDDLYEYIEYHKLTDIYVLGHSMGGKTAMFLACKYPDLIKKLIVADIGPQQYEPHHTLILDTLGKINFEVLTSRKSVEQELEKTIKDFGTRQFLLKNLYWKTKTELGFRFNLNSIIKNKLVVGEGLSNEMNSSISTLFLKGEKSDYISENDTDKIKKHFPNYQIKTIKNAGHWLHAENPKDFYNEVMSFFV
ncbi:MAG: alpha/beta fold hydrolase [Flavobacteriaceae bacterium]|nr:alpha/beta fold hydrolase [Flavobacteriaceae bacterium]